MHIQSRVLYALLIFSILGLAGLAYAAGLGGTFLLDDYGTLPALGQWGRIDTFEKLFTYVNGGFAGPTGRPVALLSFALNAQTWPAHPAPFLATSIVLHLFNAIVLFAVIHRLACMCSVNKPYVFSSVAAAIWLLHPMHVSTVLYIVQRMAVLEATFNLMAIWAYLWLRGAIIQLRFGQAALAIVAVAFCSLLAVGSKETAILIPLQLLLIERLLLWRGANESNKWLTLCKWMLIYVPSAVVIGYLLNRWGQYWLTGISHSRREFTVWERQLSEFRIVAEYLWMFIMPKMQTAGVFHDGYLISKNLLNPVSTLISLMIHTTLITASVLLRRKMPLICFGVLWFYVGHVLESTVIQLELKFEHRNYLPIMGLAVSAAAAFLKLPWKKTYAQILLGLYLCVLASVLYLRASLWGNPLAAAEVWISENPKSYRAREFAAEVYSRAENGRHRAAYHLQAASAMSGNNPVVDIKLIVQVCDLQQVTDSWLASIAQGLPSAPMNWQVGTVLNNLLNKIVSGECNLSYAQYMSLADAALANKMYTSTLIGYQLKHNRAKAELLLGDAEKAGEMFLTQFNPKRTPLGLSMNQAILLASNNQLEWAFELIDRAIEARATGGIDSEFLLSQAVEIRDNIAAELNQAERSK